MTTPGGVPNLPPGALTLDTLASDTQDVSQPAMKARAAGRFSSIFSSSTGLSPSSNITPFGILTSIFAGFNSTVANADPADVDGPEDLPGLLIDFIESLPFVGQFVGLLEAILGTYDGEDTTLLTVQSIFAPIRAVVDVITGLAGGSTSGSLTSWLNPSSGGSGIFAPLLSGIPGVSTLSGFFGFLAPTGSTSTTNVFSPLLAGIPGVSTLTGLLGFLQPTTSSSGIFAPLINGVTGGTTNPLSSLLSSLTGTATTASTANTNANTALSNFTSLINGVVGGSGNPLSALISSLTGTASTASSASSTSSTNASNITSLISNLFGGSSILSQVQPGAVGGVTSGGGTGLLADVQSFLGNVFGGLTNQSGTNATLGAVGQATASTSDTIAGQGAAITQILAALSTGTKDADDFERSSIGANWIAVTSSGTLSIPDSHNLHFSGTGSAEYVMRKTLITASDRMTSTIALNQSIPTYFFLPVPYGGYIDVWVRMTAFTTFATRSGVRLRINSTGLGATWVLANVVSGTATTLQSGTCPIPAAGGFPTLEAGAAGTTNRYLGTLNGAQIACDFTDSGGVTTIGASNRYRGFGGLGNTGIGTAQGTPDIRQWTGG